MGVKGLLGRFFKSRVRQSGRTSTEPHKQGYYDAIKETFEDIINVETLHIDANFLFYAIVAYAYGLGDFGKVEYIRKLKQMTQANRDKRCFAFIVAVLMDIIRTINPSKQVTINIDGPVPMAKICQQRQRRYKHALELGNELFDTNCITPGTPWMMALDAYLKREIYKMHEALQYTSTVKFVYSSCLSPGEGEHKIFDRLRPEVMMLNQGEGRHVILGGDTDLILLSIISGIDNLFVMTDMQFTFIDGEETITLRADMKRKPSVIDIRKLREAIRKELNMRNTAIHDFVFIISLVGNDFLPRLASMEDLTTGIDAIMNAVRLLDPHKQPIIDVAGNYAIIWSNVLLVLEMIEKGDDRLFLPSEIKRIVTYNQSLDSTRSPWRPFQAALQVTSDKNNLDELRDNFRGAWYYNALCPKATHSNFTVEYESIFDMTIQYLRGLNWINLYYHYGSDVITWKWQYPYYYAPLLSDIIETLRTLRSEEAEIFSRLIYSGPKIDEIRINPLHQLIAVMPPVSLDSVPTPLHSLWSDNSSVSDLMVVSIVIDQDGLIPSSQNKYYEGKYRKAAYKEDSLEGIIFVPFADYDRLITAFRELKLPDVVVAPYTHANDITIILTGSKPLLGAKPSQFTKLTPMTKGKRAHQGERKPGRKPYSKHWSHQQHDTSRAAQASYSIREGY